MHFQNANGEDIYILPGLLLMLGNHADFALIKLNEVCLEYSATRFIESERIPQDTKTVGETWAKVNKDGSPNRRFKDNYRIPIVQYGTLRFSSSAGMNEEYLISNPEKAESFAKAFAAHCKSVPSAEERASA